MGDMNEDILKGLSSSVPSLDLNQLIALHGLNQFPGSTQNTDVIHTSSLNMTGNVGSDTEANDVKNNARITVLIENRMVRFRYDSELNNRNYGKEVLAKILVHDFFGKVRIRIHAVDDKKLKAHPFCLIGDKCIDGVYIEEHDITAEKNECICKATPRIPKQKDYEYELNKRRKVIHDVNRFPFITPEMNKEDYWSTNKNIKESKEIILVVEVLCFDPNDSGNHAGYSIQYSHPINNAKDGKKFEVYAISPVTSSVLGSPHDSHFIILTADSYSPNESDIEVRFCDDGNWSNNVKGKVIKNAIEFKFPGYGEPLSFEKTIHVYVYDKKRKIETSKVSLILRPTDGDIIAHKRKKVTKFSLPDYMENVKKEEVASCSGGARQIHRLKKKTERGSATSSPLDLTKLEEEGLLSLNISSPMNQNESSLNSTSLSDFNNASTTINGTIPNTIPAILIPSGSRDMQINTGMFSSQDIQQSQPDVNNIAITNSSVTQNSDSQLLNLTRNQPANLVASSENVTTSNDLSQQQTLSIGDIANYALQDPAKFQEILRVLGLNSEGQIPQSSNSPSMNFNYDYDPHDIRIEDLVDELEQNDIEVDCDQISSSTEKKGDCEKCVAEKNDKKSDKELKSEKKVTKTECKKDNSERITELQSDVITSNVHSDIEEG